MPRLPLNNDPGLALDLPVIEGLLAQVRRKPGDFTNTAALRRAAGVTAARLTALFVCHLHQVPEAFLHQERVERARRALLAARRETQEAHEVDIALAGGWVSAATFRRDLTAATGLPPEEYARLPGRSDFTFALPPGFLAGPTLTYLGRDPGSPCERVDGTTFLKVLRLAGRPVRLSVELSARTARCRIEARRPHPPSLADEAHRTARRLLGLVGGNADPAPFLRKVRRHPPLLRLVAGREGMRIPLSGSVFEGLAWAIVGQQVNLQFAAALRREVVLLAGEPAGDGFRTHPTAEAVARLDPADLTARRFSGRKAEYLIDTARAIAAGALALETFPHGTATRAEQSLLALRGLGPWTAQYVLLRACGFADCLPVGDAGLAAALTRFFALDHRPDPQETRVLTAHLAPYRSLATAHFWASLGDPP